MSMQHISLYFLLLSAGLFSACSNQTARVPPNNPVVNPNYSGGNNTTTVVTPGNQANSSGIGDRSGIGSSTLGGNNPGNNAHSGSANNPHSRQNNSNTGGSNNNFPNQGVNPGQGGYNPNSPGSAPNGGQFSNNGPFPGNTGNYVKNNPQNFPDGQHGGINNNAINSQTNYTPADLRNKNNLLSQRILYFDYDLARIKSQYYPALDAHAQLLKNYPNLSIRLEGHADERGSRAYNVALSEQRGFSVLDYLLVKGVKRNQMDVVGYGEEIPASLGGNERSWSQNRRVEIIYPGG